MVLPQREGSRLAYHEVMAESPTTASLFSRVILALGVTAAIASAVGLVTLLVIYFTGSDAHPVFYGLAFWGMPVAFIMLCLYMVTHIIGRRRMSAA